MILLALLVVLFPIRVIYKDGGSVGYRSVLGLYEVRDWHQEMPLPEGGVKEGWSIEIAGIEIYNSTHVAKYPRGSGNMYKGDQFLWLK